MARPRTHDAATEQRLLAAAQSLLDAEGLDGFSVRKVAAAAGTTQRAIYSRFGGKGGLLQTLYDGAFGDLAAALDAIPPTGDALADLLAVGPAFRAWAFSRPDLYRLLFENQPPGRGVQPGAASAAAWVRLETRAAACLAASGKPPDAARPLALAFHVCCEGLAGTEMRGMLGALLPEPEPIEFWRATLEALVNGFTQTRGKPSSAGKAQASAKPL
jgi:AcrR family transcriptional regulator